MADGSGPGRVTLSGVVLAGLLLVLIIAAVGVYFFKRATFPLSTRSTPASQGTTARSSIAVLNNVQ